MKNGKLPPIELIESQDEYAKKLVECSNSAATFATDFLGLEIFDYNKVFLECKARFIVYRTGRQVGKSRNAAIKAIHFGYFAPLFASNIDEGEANIVIASISKDQAALIFRKIANFVNKSPTLRRKIKNQTKTELTLEWFDGSGVTNFIVRPIGDTGESLRGFTVHMAILDEAAYIPQTVYDAFIPSTVTTKPIIILTSTPKGKAGAFFNACQDSYVIFEKGVPRELHTQDNKYKWAQFHVTTFDNPLAASDPAVLDIIRGTSKAAERQELYGEFLEGGNAIIPYNLLEEAIIKIKKPKFEYYECGVDTSGKGKDETVLTVVGVTQAGLVCPVELYIELSTDQIELAKKINKYHRFYNFRRIYVDGTGIGDTLVDACRHENPGLPIYPVNFTDEKTDLYVNLERLFEERMINLSVIEDEIHQIKLAEQLQYMFWDYGKWKDQKPKARSEHHDDTADSLSLACYGQQRGDEIQIIPDDIFNW